MKYKFERLSEDNYKLAYKDKEFTFKSSVKIISELQSLIVSARKIMITELAKNGSSIKELTKEVKENGKTYYDNSNAKELEKVYQEEATMNYFNNKSVELFNMELQDLFNDIGLEEANEIQQFTTELVQCLSGKSIPTR
jgi:hypothetical protein